MLNAYWTHALPPQLPRNSHVPTIIVSESTVHPDDLVTQIAMVDMWTDGRNFALRAHCAHVATLLLNHVWKQMDLSNLKLNCLRIAILLVDIAKSGSLNFP